MIEQLISIAASAVVCLGAIARLNELKAERATITPWLVLEVAGLAIVAGGAVGIAGEWFLEGEQLYAETIFVAGAAIFAVGVTRTLRRHTEALLQRVDARLDAQRRDLVELAAHCSSLEDFQQLKLHACAIRARTGERRVAAADDPWSGARVRGEQFDQHLQRGD
jgi:hypothetical protein